MKKRILLFSFGAFISIIFLSMGPENRLKTTFYAYLDYFDMDKRVITHLINDSTNFSVKAECQLVYYGINKEELLTVLEDGEVDFDLSNPDGEPCQNYLIRNTINNLEILVDFELCYYNNKSVRVISFTVDDANPVCDF